MKTIESIESEINKIIYEKLFYGIRKMILEDRKNKLLKSSEYNSLNNNEKKKLLDSKYKQWFDEISTFFLSYKSIIALYPLVMRELKIREFISEEVIRIKADYFYNNIDFSLYYPTHFNKTMSKEIEDTIAELKNKKYKHIVSNYISKTDSEKSPNEPFTTAKIKFSAFYLFNFQPDYVTKILLYLYNADLITNPETIGWNIEDDIVNDIIVLLNTHFGTEKVLQYKRVYKDKNVDRYEQECIRPTVISNDRFPKNLYKLKEFQNIDFESERERHDANKLYELIFYTTLATQLKNSIYDESKIVVTVGNNTLSEQAHVIIDGQENWELLTGKFIKNINTSSGAYNQPIVILPELSVDTVLTPLDIYPYSYQSKRPPRFGIGRFVTQILERYSIGTNKQQDEILNQLIESKAVKIVKTMIHPQENSIFLIEWIIKYLPLLLDIEYQKELEEKILMVSHNEISLQSLLDEINRMIDNAFEECNFILDDTEPSKSKINLLKSIAVKHNLKIDDDVYRSNIKIDMILAKYPKEKPIVIGSCPSCNALVYQKEFIKKDTGEILYYFACENFSKNGGCSFSMWDSYIYKFFSKKSVELYTIEERAAALKKILSKKRGYLFNGFINKKSEPYEAKVLVSSYIDRDTKKEKWNFELKFLNNKKRK